MVCGNWIRNWAVAAGVAVTLGLPAIAPAQVVEPAATIAEDAESELIQQRYPNGEVMIAREVTQDAEGNYINHGSWKKWDPRGTLIMEGRYDENERSGSWTRWYQKNEVDTLKQTPYVGYPGPFQSQAIFRDGRLHGVWTILDANQRKISEITFADGERHGAATWYYANGRKMRELVYDHGVIDGELLEWDVNGNLVVRAEYQQGRRLAPKVTFHKDGKTKKTYGIYLHARVVAKSRDNWEDCELASYHSVGKDELYGNFTAWHPNGQKYFQGEFRHDQPVGEFMWWFENGQKSLHGNYVAGKQDGHWTWWHENGLKAIQGEYAVGSPTGDWLRWNKDGRVARKAAFSVGGAPKPPKDEEEGATGDDENATALQPPAELPTLATPGTTRLQR